MKKDFTKIKEKGVKDCSEQIQPLHLLELFGGIGAPRRALENTYEYFARAEEPSMTKRQLRNYSHERVKSVDYVEVLPYAVQAYNQMFDLSNRPQDIRLWNMKVNILVHGSPCFTGDTKVTMADGTQKPIRQIKIGDEVITGSHKVRGVTNWMDNGEKEIWLVKAEGLSFVHTTEHHRFWARITDSAKPDWIEACFLTEQSMIATYEKGTMVFRRVTDICNTRKKERVYDITVAEDHSFLADGYVVHNCQDFSREGRNDINTGRSILYERTLQIIDPEPEEGRPELVSRPAVIIWENVPNMANAHPDVLNNYLDAMTGYGYTNTYCGSGKSEKKGVRYDERNILVPHMLKASDYGIPQARDRFFCVSVRNDLADAYGPFVMPAPVPEQYRWKLKDYLDKEAPFEGNEPTEKELSITKEVDGQWYVKQAVQQDYGAGPGYVPVKEYQRVDFAFPGSQNRRGRVGDYAGTLTTSPRQAVLIGGRFRLFTAKEKLRLMGFRDEDYANMVRHGLTDAQISSLAGNSICVPVLEHIFLQLFRQYGEENLKK